MSFKDKIAELNLSDDIVKAVVDLHNQEIAGQYIPKERFDTVNNKKNSLEEQIDTLQKDIEKFSESGEEVETLKRQLSDKAEEIQKAQDESKAAIMEANKKFHVMLDIMNDAEKVPNDAELVYSLLDMSPVKFNENGEVVGGLEEAKNKLFEEKAFLFKPVQEEPKEYSGWIPKGKNLPAGVGAPGSKKEDINEYAALGKSMAEEKLRLENKKIQE